MDSLPKRLENRPENGLQRAPKSWSFAQCLRYLGIFNIDVYLFFVCFTLGVTSVSLNQLVQDKVCLNEMKISPEICRDIQNHPDYTMEAVNIYRKATMFGSLNTVISFIPAIVFTLFLGRWLDRYPQYLKYVLVLPAIGGTVATVVKIYLTFHFETDYWLLLFAAVPVGLSGSLTASFAFSYTYVTRVTKPKYRAIRFGMFQSIFTFGFISSVTIGGQILAANPWFANQFRNYLGVFGVSGASGLFSAIWAMFMLKHENHKSHRNQENHEKLKHKTSLLTACKEIFDLTNIKEICKTFRRTREHGNHKRLWHMIMAMLIVVFTIMGETVIAFQFVQRVYRWDAAYFSNIKSLTTIIPCIGNAFVPLILGHLMKLGDAKLGIIGSISYMFSLIIKGSVLEPWAYFTSETVSLADGLRTLSLRSYITQIVEPNEVGQIFTVLTSLEALAPILSSLIYTGVFNATIVFYPGFIYHFVGFISLYPFILLIYIDLTNRKWLKSSRETGKSIPATESKVVDPCEEKLKDADNKFCDSVNGTQSFEEIELSNENVKFRAT